jgi:hypothetical protein
LDDRNVIDSRRARDIVGSPQWSSLRAGNYVLPAPSIRLSAALPGRIPSFRIDRVDQPVLFRLGDVHFDEP